MNEQRKKRARRVRSRTRGRLAVLLAEMSLAGLLLAPGYVREPSVACGVEAKVLIERIGPKGTSAATKERRQPI